MTNDILICYVNINILNNISKRKQFTIPGHISEQTSNTTVGCLSQKQLSTLHA